MDKKYWNNRIEWLKAVCTGWFNEDYIEFLVEKVWKIKNPVNVVDFGCGFGYIGLVLLPILPKGSTYTGIDIGEKLIDEAKNIFKDLNYQTEFIIEDLNKYVPKCGYDIAISQAVLRHIPNAENMLRKMIDSVDEDGYVICMETDLEMEKAGLFFNDLDYEELGLVSLMRKMWKKELHDGGRDYRFAIKIPSLMQEFGLHNVGVRISDCANFINPHENEKERLKKFESFTKAWGWDKLYSEEDKVAQIKSLKDKGLNEQEAEAYFENEQKIRNYLINNKDSAYVIKAPCTIISYGRKKLGNMV